MGSDLLALAMRRDVDARDELAARLTSLNRVPGLDNGARHELEALLHELRDQVSVSMRRVIDLSLRNASDFRGGVAARASDRDEATPRGHEGGASDDELVERAMNDEAERLVALARRPDLPLRVSGILAARGHLPALYALMGNRSAAIGHSGLLALADLALGDPGLRNLLISRHDLPEDAVSLLWPHLADDEKARLLSANAPYAEDDLKEIAREAELDLHAALRRGELPDSLNALTVEVERGREDADGVIELLCAEERFADLGEFLAWLTSGPLLSCLNLLAMPSPRGAALLCRAAGLARGSYVTIARLRRHLGWQALSAASVGAEAFDSTSRSSARRIFALYAEMTAELSARATADWR
jgi:uncharacterized protein (DUF2336 family)